MFRTDRLMLAIVGESVKKDLHLKEWEFGLLTGMGFTMIYSVSALIFGALADRFNRKNLLVITVLLYSMITGLTGFSTKFYQLLLARIGLALGQSGSTPLAFSIISDYFPVTRRSTALSIYTFGIYIGYGLSYLLGGLIESRWNWRWCFYLISLPGFFFGILCMLTVLEPERGVMDRKAHEAAHLKTSMDVPAEDFDELNSEIDQGDSQELSMQTSFHGFFNNMWKSVKFMITHPSFWFVAIGAGIRNFVGYSQSAFLPKFFTEIHGETIAQQSRFLTWIPPVFGIPSIFIGGVLGDFLSKWTSERARAILICISNGLAIPLVLVVLLIPSSLGSYLFMMLYYFVSESWGGNSGALITLLSPPKFRSFMTAVYFLILSSIGGIGPLIVGGLLDIQSSSTAVRPTLSVVLVLGFALSMLSYGISLIRLNKDISQTRKVAVK